jgi:hypothetical protein
LADSDNFGTEPVSHLSEYEYNASHYLVDGGRVALHEDAQGSQFTAHQLAVRTVG